MALSITQYTLITYLLRNGPSRGTYMKAFHLMNKSVSVCLPALRLEKAPGLLKSLSELQNQVNTFKTCRTQYNLRPFIPQFQVWWTYLRWWHYLPTCSVSHGHLLSLPMEYSLDTKWKWSISLTLQNQFIMYLQMYGSIIFLMPLVKLILLHHLRPDKLPSHLT